MAVSISEKWVIGVGGTSERSRRGAVVERGRALWTATAALGALLVHILGADEAATTVWPPRTAGRNALANDLIVKDVY